MSRKSNATAIAQILAAEGYNTVAEYASVYDSLGIGCICMNAGCENLDYFEPDCQNGFCEDCETYSMVSLYVLAGII